MSSSIKTMLSDELPEEKVQKKPKLLGLIILIFLIQVLYYVFFFKQTLMFELSTIHKVHLHRHLRNKDVTFTTPIKTDLRPNDIYIIKLAVHSWLSQSNTSRLQLFVDSKNISIIELIENVILANYDKSRVDIIEFEKHSCGNRPLLSEWVQKSVLHCKTQYLTFVNSDIILSDIWYEELTKYFGAFRYPTLFFANRYELKLYGITKTVLDTPEKLDSYYKMIVQRKFPNTIYQFNPCGIDIFTFDIHNPPLPTNNLSEFCLGCPKWDDYITYLGNHYGIVSCYAEAIPIYHLQLKSTGKWYNDKKCEQNQILASLTPRQYFRDHLCTSTDFIINETGLSLSQIHKKYDGIIHIPNSTNIYA